MYIKYEFCGSPVIVSIPARKSWMLRHRAFDDEGNAVFENLLEIEGCEPVLLQDPDVYCAGRPDLPAPAVGMLLEDVVNTVAQRLASDPELHLIDIPAITHELINKTYFERWERQLYVIADEDGRW